MEILLQCQIISGIKQINLTKYCSWSHSWPFDLWSLDLSCPFAISFCRILYSMPHLSVSWQKKVKCVIPSAGVLPSMLNSNISKSSGSMSGHKWPWMVPIGHETLTPLPWPRLEPQLTSQIGLAWYDFLTWLSEILALCKAILGHTSWLFPSNLRLDIHFLF